jgi:putative membrane protein
MSMMYLDYTPFGWFLMMLLWALVIFGVVALAKLILYHGSTEKYQNKSALDLLKERYVKGDIDKKEFEEKKKDIV